MLWQLNFVIYLTIKFPYNKVPLDSYLHYNDLFFGLIDRWIETSATLILYGNIQYILSFLEVEWILSI